jgi:hypothetical protein
VAPGQRHPVQGTLVRHIGRGCQCTPRAYQAVAFGPREHALLALAVPCGFSADTLPLSMQIVGTSVVEGLVMSACDAYQRVTDWHLRGSAERRNGGPNL